MKNSKHHIFFPASAWDNGCAKALRQHPYCQKRMRRRGLHDFIHDCIEGVQAPDERTCAFVLQQIQWFYDNGIIEDHDSITQRITVLVSLLKESKAADNTINDLVVQRERVQCFYGQGGH